MAAIGATASAYGFCSRYLSISPTTTKAATSSSSRRFSGGPFFKHKLITWKHNACSCSSSSSSNQVLKSDEEVVKEEENEKGNGNGNGNSNWKRVIPLVALPKGERRLIRQDGETILLLWYRDRIYAVENRSPAEGAYSEGLLNARLMQLPKAATNNNNAISTTDNDDGCIVCPSTDSTFRLSTGDIVDWYPKNPVLRWLTPPLRKLFVYPTRLEDDFIYIDMGLLDDDQKDVFETATATAVAASQSQSDADAEIIFSGQTQAGATASNVNVDEVRMVVDESETGFGFTTRAEVLNGRAAIAGLLFLINFELLTGKGFLQGTGVLNFLYGVSQGVIQRSA